MPKEYFAQNVKIMQDEYSPHINKEYSDIEYIVIHNCSIDQRMKDILISELMLKHFIDQFICLSDKKDHNA